MANNKDFIVKNGLVVLAQGASPSINTFTGAMVVYGGVGVGESLRASAVFDNGARVWTTATLANLSQLNNDTGFLSTSNIANYAVINITTGSNGISITGTSTRTISLTDTLQLVTLRGATTDQQLQFLNTASSTVTNTSNALYMAGGAWIDKDLYVGGQIIGLQSATLVTVTGNNGQFFGDLYGFGALYAGVSSFTTVSNTVLQTTANINGFAQNNFQNTSNTNQASTDWVATSAIGNDSNNFIDFGIASGLWDGTHGNSLGNAVTGADGYLYVKGGNGYNGNLVLGTASSGSSVKIIVASSGSSAISAVFNPRGTNATSTQSGAFIVYGGAAVGRDLYVGGSTYLQGDLYVDGTQFSVNSTNINIGDKTLTLSSATTSSALAINSGIVVGVGTGTGFVSFLYDGDQSWASKGNIVPAGLRELGVQTNPWNVVWSNAVYDNEQRVVTSVEPQAGGGIGLLSVNQIGPSPNFLLTNTGVLSVIAGDDISVSGATQDVTISSTATLQSVTTRGSTTTNAVYINNNTTATNTTTGALKVTGGVGIGGRLYVKEQIYSAGAQAWTTATLTDNSQLANGAQYLTSATIGAYGVSAINPGTGIQVSGTTGTVTVTNVGVVSLQGSTYIGISANSGSNVIISNLGVQQITTGAGIIVSASTGNIQIRSSDTLQLVTERGNVTNQAIAITATNLSVSTVSGQALLVSGGIGAQAVYADTLVDNNKRVITGVVPTAGTAISVTAITTSGPTASFTINNTGVTSAVGTTYMGVSGATGAVTFTNLGVQTLTAGTGTAVSKSTGTVTVWSTASLQTVTDFGATTNNAIRITDLTETTNTDNGALVVDGGIGIGKSLFIGGDLTILGTINANTVAGSIDTATNIFGGTSGGIAYQETPGNTKFIGIGAPTTILQSNGTSATWVTTASIQVGSAAYATNAANVIGGFVSASTGSFSGNVAVNINTPSTGTDNGALTVAGGVGVAGDLYAGAVYDGGTRVIKQVETGLGISVSTSTGPTVLFSNTGVLSVTGDAALGVSEATGNITLTNLGVTSLSTGSGLVVSGSTGSVTIESIDTLQLVTTRGASTDKALSVANTLTVDSLIINNGFFGARNYIEASQAVGTNSTSNYWIKVVEFELPNLGDSCQFKAKSIVKYFNNVGLSDNAEHDVIWVSLAKDTGTTLLGTAYWFNESSESAVSASAANHTITYNGTSGKVEVYRRATQANARAFVTILEQFAANASAGIQSVAPTVVTTSSWVAAVPTLGSTLTLDDPDTLSQEDITVTGTLTAQGLFLHSGNTFTTNNTTTNATVNIGSGGTTSGNSKTINIGTNGLTGSTSTINIGSNVAQGVLTIATTETDITSTVNATSTNTGALTVAGGVGIGRDLWVGEDAKILSPTDASSTTTGALTVAGGVGIGGNLYAAGLMYAEGAQVITAATLGAFGVSQINAGPYIGVTPTSGTGSVTVSNLGVQQITTGSGIAVTTSTGTVNIASIDTLQLVTGRGAATTNAIQILNNQPAISTSTGSLVVLGGIGVAQGLYVGGGSTFLGTITGTISTAQNLSLGATGSIPYQSTVSNTSFLTIGANGFILQSSGTLPQWVSTSTLSVGFADRANTSTNLAGGVAGQVPYQTAGGLTGYTGGSGLAGNVLVSNGTAAPTFNSTLTLSAILNATNTMSGTLQVRGGVGIGGDAWIGGDLWSRGSTVVTANNLGLFGVSQIVAGPAISVSPGAGTGTVTIGNLGVTSLTTSSLGGIAITTSTGTVNIASIDTLQLVTQRGPSTNQPLSFTATNLSSSTSTGQALLVSGGIGALAVYARVLNDSGNRVITTVTPSAGPGIGISSLINSGPASTFNITNLGVQTLTAGTDTAVSASTGTITVWSTATLESVTGRGNSTTNQIFILNTASAINTETGALQVVGGIGVQGDIWARNIYTNGQIVGGATSTSSNISGGYAGSIPYQEAPGLTAWIDIGAAGSILTSNGSTATWQTAAALVAGSATTATNVAGGFAGWIPIQNAAGKTTFINSGTQNQLLMMGINSASWVTTTTIHVGQSVFATTASNIANGVGGQIPYQIGVGQTSFTALGSAGTVLVSGGTGTPQFQSTLTLAGTTQATSTDSGAFQVIGGAGIGGNLWVGGVLYATVQGSINTATNIAGGTTGSIPIQSANGQTKFINIGTNGTLLQSNGTTATFVSTATLVVGFADSTRGATNVSGGAAGSLVYQTAPSASGFVGIGGSGSILQVSIAGTPTWVTTATVVVGGAVTASTASNLSGGALGSIPYQTLSGRTGFVPIGPAGSILQSDGSTASWYTTATLLSGSAQNLNGGLTGFIPYQESSGLTRFIGTGTAGSILQMGSAGTATFIASGLITVGNATNATTSTRTQTVWGGTQGQILYQSGANTTGFVNTGTEGMVLISRPTGPAFVNTLTLAGTTAAISTTSGALVVGGGVGIAGDVYIGGVLYATVTGSINTASNLAAGAAGSLVYQSAVGTTAFLGIGANGTILRSNGSIPQWATTASTLVGDALRAQSVNNLTGGAAGSIPIQSAAGTTAFIPIGGAGTLLQSNGSTATWITTGSLVAGTAAQAVNLKGGLANQVPYQSAPDTTTFSANLTFNGTALTVGGSTTAASFIPTSATVPTNGVYLAAANTLGLAAGSTNKVNITTTGVGVNKTAAVALDVSGQITGDNIINTTLTTNATNTTNGAIRSAGGVSVVSDVFAGGVITGQNGLRRTHGRVTTSATQPLSAPTGGGEEVFGIDETWTNAELQAFFGNSSVQWVADSTAPGYAIQIDGNPSVGNNSYSSGFPYIAVESDDVFYMECWIRNDSTYVGAGHYMGSIDFDHNFANLGGNPGSFGYWVMSNTNPGTAWTKVSGYISGFGTATGQFRPGTKYWSPMALFNYSYSSGTRRSYISGWKVFRVNQNGNRTFTGITSITNSTAGSTAGTGALRVTGGASVNGVFYTAQANINGGQISAGKISINNGGAAGVGWGTGFNMGDGSNYTTWIQDGGTCRYRNTGAGGYDWYNAAGSVRTMYLDHSGNVYITADMYTSYSDVRLKDIKGNIENPLDKLREIETFYYEPNELAVSLGAQAGRKVGVSAQSVLKVLPEVVAPSPLNKEYLTVQYEKMVPLLIESIKELEKIVKDQQEQINKLKGL